KPTHNPWDLARVPGGSSGGSAAAVARDLAAGSLGTDTGGSGRQPAAVCGGGGLQPTDGRGSRFGVVGVAASLDHVGPITRDVQDAALVLEVIAGLDPHDSTSVPEAVPHYAAALTGDVRGVKIGVPKEYFTPGMDADVQRSVREAITVLEKL